MHWSIRYKFLLPLGFLLLIVVGISIWSALVAARHAEARIAQQLNRVAETLSTATFPLTPNVLLQMKGLSGAEYVLIQGESEITTFQTNSFEPPTQAIFQANPDPNRLGPALRIEQNWYRSKRLLLKNPHPNVGSTLFIFYPEELLQEAIWSAVRPSVVGFISALAGIVFTYGIAQRLIQRIRELEKRTRIIASGDFSPMPVSYQQDELRDLAVSINEMAQRLTQLQQSVLQNERFRLLGQLSSGLAHQLRNSVTGARLAVQLHAADCPGEQESLDIVLRQLSLLESNLRRFMEMERDESLPKQVCSISKILEETLALLVPQFRHAGIELIKNVFEKDWLMEAEPSQINDLFWNLITNAIEAAGPGGRVEVRTTIEKDRLWMDIVDSGPGPDPKIASTIFDAFVTSKSEGIGLGLAVAKRAVENHHGSLRWFRESNHTVFRIEFPAYLESNDGT